MTLQILSIKDERHQRVTKNPEKNPLFLRNKIKTHTGQAGLAPDLITQHRFRIKLHDKKNPGMPVHFSYPSIRGDVQ
jgi:hypothetical protein